MNITVQAHDIADDVLPVTLTVSAEDVDRTIKETYAQISKRYTFQGFRRGRTPRPVIDAQLGRVAVLEDATNELLNDVEPQLLTELDVVPVGQVAYGDEGAEPPHVEDHADYVVNARITLTPTGELSSYDPVSIDMPPEAVTEAEIDRQIDLLLSYQSSFEDVDRPIEEGDFATVAIEGIEGGEDIADESALIRVGAHASRFPHEIEHAIVGLKVGESVDVTYAPAPAAEGAEGEEATVKVTVKGIRALSTPELTDALANEAFGFKTVEELRQGVGEEIAESKAEQLPQLKEDRALAALTSRLELEELPAAYLDQVFRDIAENIMDELQEHGLTLEVYAQSQGMTVQQFVARLHEEAGDHARESVALDALVRHLGIEVEDGDVEKQLTDAGVEDPAAFLEGAEEQGRMPAIRRSVRRAKALEWVVENAGVTEVDELAHEHDHDEAGEADEAEEAAPVDEA